MAKTPDKRSVCPDGLRAFLFDHGRGYPCVVTAIDRAGCDVTLARPIPLASHVDIQVVGWSGSWRVFVREQSGANARLVFEVPPAEVVPV